MQPRSILGGRTARAARVVFGLTALFFLVRVFLQTLERAEGRVFPAPAELAVGFALVLIGLAWAGRSWICLFDPTARRAELVSGFFTAQVAKYVPGSIWQPVSLVASTRRATGRGVARTTATVVIHMLVQLVAGATLGAGVVFSQQAPSWLRLAALSGILSLGLLKRSWMIAALTVAGRMTGRTFSEDAIPGQRRIAASYLWGLGTITAAGTAFSVLWMGLDWSGLALRVCAFGFAWAVGYVAIPFPSGIGVREWALIAAVGVPGSSAPIIAASGAHRLVVIVAELTAILIAGGHLRRRPEA